MRIGLIIDELAPGSTPKLIGWPIKKLLASGVDAEAIVIIEKDHWQRNKELYDFHLGGIKIRYLFPQFPYIVRKLNFKIPGMSFFSLHHLASFLFADRAFMPGEFDMFIANCQYSTFVARNLKRHYQTPFLTLIWDPSTFTAEKIYKSRLGWQYPFLYFAADKLDRFAFKECEAIITSGKFHHGHLKRITSKPLEVLAAGCFPLEVLPPFSSREPMILAYDRWDIGNIPTILLDILQGVQRNDVVLTIGGFWHPFSLKADFINEVRRRGLERRVNLVGPFDERLIQYFASKAMVHIHPVHEAFGMQSLEAAACGCPIIIPAGSGVTDLFEHGKHGYFPVRGDIAEFTEFTNMILCNSQKAEEMSRAAWNIARKYTWDFYALQLLQIVKKYLKKG